MKNVLMLLLLLVTSSFVTAQDMGYHTPEDTIYLWVAVPNLGETLEVYQKDCGLSDTQVADYLEYPEYTWRMVKSGKVYPLDLRPIENLFCIEIEVRESENSIWYTILDKNNNHGR